MQLCCLCWGGLGVDQGVCWVGASGAQRAQQGEGSQAAIHYASRETPWVIQGEEEQGVEGAHKQQVQAPGTQLEGVGGAAKAVYAGR